MMKQEFNFDEFQNADYSRRTKELELDNFPKKGICTPWMIQQLESADIVGLDEEQAKFKKIDSMIQVASEMSSSEKDSQIEALRKLLGVNEKISPNLLRRYKIFELGSVGKNKPKNRPQTVLFAKRFPVHFKYIVDEIMELSVMGAELKKKL